MKNRFKSLIMLLVAVILAVQGTVCCLADEAVDYGSFEKGYYSTDNKVRGYNFWKHDAVSVGLQNGDFEAGYKYWWSSTISKDTSQVFRAEECFTLQTEENGNHYMLSNTTQDYQNIATLPFTLENLTVGQELVPIYNWRGSSQFQVVLQQWNANGENRIAFGTNQIILEAENDDEWTTQFTYRYSGDEKNPCGVVEPDSEGKFKFTLRVEVISPSTEVEIDNIQLGIYRRSERKIYSLDGKTVLYDFEAIEASQVQDEVEEDEPYFDLDEEEEDTELTEDNINEDNKSEGLGWLLYVIIGTGVVVVAAAAVITVLVIKKKKAAKPEADTSLSEEAAEPEQATEENENKE